MVSGWQADLRRHFDLPDALPLILHVGRKIEGFQSSRRPRKTLDDVSAVIRREETPSKDIIDGWLGSP